MVGKKGILIAAVLWVVIIGLLAVAGKFFILPYFKNRLEAETGSDSRYKHEVIMAADSFSGYCILRSPIMARNLGKNSIKLTVRDDKADYTARIKALKKRKINMAVFTVDSFISAGARLGDFPGTIVLVIDETQGADAIVAYKTAVKDLEDLDDSAARIVLTPQSPSEFLARTVIAHFDLPDLPEKWWIEAQGAEDVFRRFMHADKGLKRAYVLWEPYVSRALEVPGATLLLDSSKLKGYIVDVLVAERKFLLDNPEIVRDVVAAYLQAQYHYHRRSDGMKQLVIQDAQLAGAEKLTPELARKMVAGIQWKNTLENYAYFGLLPPQQAGGQQHIEDVIGNIIDVLIKTGALQSDPLPGKTGTIFYSAILKELRDGNFHPGKKVDIIQGLGDTTTALEEIHTSPGLPALSDAEWESLQPVGTLRVKSIKFARGTARINLQSRRELTRLAQKLKAWPDYYLRVVGHTRKQGDAAANTRLATQRAQAAARELIRAGIDADRIRTEAAKPSDDRGASQSVTFELGRMPY